MSSYIFMKCVEENFITDNQYKEIAQQNHYTFLISKLNVEQMKIFYEYIFVYYNQLNPLIPLDCSEYLVKKFQALLQQHFNNKFNNILSLNTNDLNSFKVCFQDINLILETIEDSFNNKIENLLQDEEFYILFSSDEKNKNESRFIFLFFNFFSYMVKNIKKKSKNLIFNLFLSSIARLVLENHIISIAVFALVQIINSYSIHEKYLFIFNEKDRSIIPYINYPTCFYFKKPNKEKYMLIQEIIKKYIIIASKLISLANQIIKDETYYLLSMSLLNYQEDLESKHSDLICLMIQDLLYKIFLILNHSICTNI